MLKLQVMRAIIDLPEEQAAKLKTSCARLGISRAEAVRRAIDLFVVTEQNAQVAPTIAKAFGLFAKRNNSAGKVNSTVNSKVQSKDGVQYQRALRSDWG